MARTSSSSRRAPRAKRILTGLVIAGACVALALPAGAAAKNKACPRIRVRITLKVTAVRGANCATADRVLTLFFKGKGKLHGPKHGPLAADSWTVQRWSCGYFAGGGACIKGGKSYKTARSYIVANAVG